MLKENYLSMLSGVCASGGSVFGKLFANTNVSSPALVSEVCGVNMIEISQLSKPPENTSHISGILVDPFTSCFYLALMILMHCMMWTFFTRALVDSKTSVGPTLASAATNYLFSGFIGVFVFGEVTSILYWSGIFVVLIGLILISKGNQKQHID